MNKNIDIKNGTDALWEYYYNLAKDYHEYYGNLEIPQSFKTTNGYEYDELGVSLGYWINIQKNIYNGKLNNRILKYRANLLKKIGMNFEKTRETEWLKNYNLAKIYYDHYGNSKISRNFKTRNGYKYDESGVSLGLWLNNQRTAYNGKGTSRLTEEQIELLEEIEINWFNENTDQKLQNEIIDKKNKIKKQIEILNRVRSYLNTLDENKVYSKEEINSGFVKKLSK